MSTRSNIKHLWGQGERIAALDAGRAVLVEGEGERHSLVEAAEQFQNCVTRNSAVPEAEAALRLVGDLLRRAWRDDPEQLVYADAPLAAFLAEQGRWAESEKLLLASRAVAERLRTPHAPNAVRDIDVELGLLYMRCGRQQYAERYFLSAAELDDSQSDPFLRTVTPLNELQALYSAQGRYADAAAVVSRLLARLRPNDPDRAHWITLQGDLLNAARRETKK